MGLSAVKTLGVVPTQKAKPSTNKVCSFLNRTELLKHGKYIDNFMTGFC